MCAQVCGCVPISLSTSAVAIRCPMYHGRTRYRELGKCGREAATQPVYSREMQEEDGSCRQGGMGEPGVYLPHCRRAAGGGRRWVKGGVRARTGGQQ